MPRVVTCHYNNDHNDNDNDNGNDTRQCDKHRPRAERAVTVGVWVCGVWVWRYFKTSSVEFSTKRG